MADEQMLDAADQMMGISTHPFKSLVLVIHRRGMIDAAVDLDSGNCTNATHKLTCTTPTHHEARNLLPEASHM